MDEQTYEIVMGILENLKPTTLAAIVADVEYDKGSRISSIMGCFRDMAQEIGESLEGGDDFGLMIEPAREYVAW